MRLSALPILLLSATGAFAGFNQPGNIYIADQFNNRIIEIDSNNNIVWQFGSGSNVAGPTSVVAPNDAERVGDMTLISGTGAPPGSEPGCDNGCPDNRVILVDSSGNIVWQYGQAGVTGSGPDQLNAPVAALFLPGFKILITDQGNQRVILVDSSKNILWQYGTTGVSGSGPNQLNNPNSAEMLPNGDVLIADESNNRVIEVSSSQQIVWQYPVSPSTNKLNGPAFASRLESGDTIISDSLNNRIVAVTEHYVTIFRYSTNIRPGSVANPTPTRAVMLKAGDILISDQFNDQVFEIDTHGHVVRTYGVIGVPGSAPGFLNAPYDAKVVGDYRGLTPP